MRKTLSAFGQMTPNQSLNRTGYLGSLGVQPFARHSRVFVPPISDGGILLTGVKAARLNGSYNA
jgi:hypothetical protein